MQNYTMKSNILCTLIILCLSFSSRVQASCSTTARDLQEAFSDVQCPPGCLADGKSVWGTEYYTDDSSICRAAIHAGIITNAGGRVTVQKAPGQASYTGSTSNGITTNNYGAWPGSFVFVKLPNPVTPEPTKETTQNTAVQASCSTTARDLQEAFSNVQCPPGCLADGKSVWGTEYYTDDSSICRAAIHAGIITNAGGRVTVQKTPGQASYTGSTSNGITTNNYGAWPGSFVFVKLPNPVTPEPTKETTQNTAVQASCSTTARDLQEAFSDVQCPPGCLADGKSVWGTEYYTDDSSVCRAAIHVGALSDNGGILRVKKKPGQNAYSGSTRNGVTTSSFGAWPGSFVIEKV